MVTNAAGSDSASTTILVTPYFVSDPADIARNVSMNVTLTCVAEAFPSPDYTWERVDGGPIRNQVTGRNTAMLVFISLMFGDEGEYYCNATSNGVTIQTQPATITRESNALAHVI